MKLLHISLFVCLLLAVAVDGAKKRKNNHRDRDEVSSRQQTEDEQPSARKDDERQKETGGRRKEKEEKEEKPLKKAEDESSSEEEDEKKKENKTTVAPSRKRREYERQPMTVYTDVDLIDENRRFYRMRRDEETHKQGNEFDLYPLDATDFKTTRSGRSRRGENVMHKAKEMEELPLNNAQKGSDTPIRHRPKRAENSLQKAKEADQIPLNPSNNQQASKDRPRRSEHVQTGEVVLSRAQELNDGERTPLVFDENSGRRPDYRKNSRPRRNGEFVLGKAQELNGGEKTEIGKDETAKRPDYRKNSRTRRTLERHRRNHAVVSSEEDTLKKAEELNGGEQRPVDKQPSQSQMPEKVKAHKHRAARHLIAKSQPGNVVTSREEEETEEWKLENEEDYDDGGNY